MRRPFLVSHPVPYRYVPRRGRNERFGFGSTTTDVMVEGFSGEPVRLGTLAKTSVFAADGAAWMAPANTRTGIGIGEEGLRRVLSDVVPSSDPELALIADYLVRSPICYSRVTAPSYARGSSIARGGDVRTDRIGEMLDDGNERAEQGVREFVADRIRIHRGHVYLRYEGIILHGFDLEGKHHAHLSTAPRSELGTAYTAATRTAGPNAPVEQGGVPWIPQELLRDDHWVWYANAFAHRASESAKSAAYGYDMTPAVDEARQPLLALAPEIARLERESWTSSLSGERLQPSLVTLVKALRGARDYAEARAAQRGDREEARRADWMEAAVMTVAYDVLPRLARTIPVEDRSDLASLAP